MKHYLECNAYGERFIIECNSEQELVSCKIVLDKQWVEYEEADSEKLSLPLIYANQWLKEYVPAMILNSAQS